VVYGPQDDAAKIEFLHELQEFWAACDEPGLICGDFKLILRDEDKNNGHINRRMMNRFRRVTNDLALKEVYLNGRRYTWSNEQSLPTLVPLDRVLCTVDWEEQFGECHLCCLTSVVSDHSPLLLDCSPTHPATQKISLLGLLGTARWFPGGRLGGVAVCPGQQPLHPAHAQTSGYCSQTDKLERKIHWEHEA
jgi:hypothetical protein